MFFVIKEKPHSVTFLSLFFHSFFITLVSIIGAHARVYVCVWDICHGVVHILCSLSLKYFFFLVCRFPVSVAEQEAQCAEKIRSQSQSTGCSRAGFHADALCRVPTVPQRLLATVAQTAENFSKGPFLIPPTTTSALRGWAVVQ